MNVATPSIAAQPSNRAAIAAMTLGNVAIGLGVMMPAATMNSLIAAFDRPPEIVGHLISWPAILICVGAPLAAFLTNRWDRRLLLCGSLMLFVLGHFAFLFIDQFDAMMAIRLVMISAAAIFTPQAAATVTLIMPPEKRAGAMALVFSGWAIATALGIPLMSLAADAWGWKAVAGGIFGISLATCIALAITLPGKILAAPMNGQDWLAITRHPTLLALFGITAILSSGQFILYPYIAAVLKRGAGLNAAEIASVQLAFGVANVIGSQLVANFAGRMGAASGNITSVFVMMIGLLLWGGLATGFVGAVACATIWGLGFSSANAMQQARLGAAAPLLASAAIALNTSCIYLGNAVGATTGGWMIASDMSSYLAFAAAAFTAVAFSVSLFAAKKLERV